MESYLASDRYDLASPDGVITSLKRLDASSVEAVVSIEEISPAFVGFKIDKERVFFNVKSTLAQIGINGIGQEYALDPQTLSATVRVHLRAMGAIAHAMLDLVTAGAYIGKLFAADERRRVRNPDYLSRMFGRSDRYGRPLLSLGGLQGSDMLILEKVEGRTIAYLSLQNGALTYEDSVRGFLPTLAKSLLHPSLPTRSLLQLSQTWVPDAPKKVVEGEILLVRTLPLHMRTVFGRVVDSLLPQGMHHTTASVLQPDTLASGDIYELFGSSDKEVNDIPLEFYTLEPHREHVFFSDRDQLQSCLEKPETVFSAFETSPGPHTHRTAVFVVKGEQLLGLTPKDWIARDPIPNEFPGLIHPTRQALMVERYIQQQPAYPFLKAIEEGLITSEGILLTRYFPTPLMKRLLLSNTVKRCLKGIYFQHPSLEYGDFFSHEDRSFLLDLAKFAIPVFWADKSSNKLLQYVPKPDKDSGMFVPLPLIETFLEATAFGIYGSNLIAADFDAQLRKLLEGVLEMRAEMQHPLLNSKTPITLVTGGGPGVMELGNRIAKSLNILSCANIVDFSGSAHALPNEQKQNAYIDAKMTYRLDRLVERQAEFHLDFPLFLMGGIGTDFEFCLEEVRRKTGSTAPTPILLLGTPDYWRKKITSRFRCNLDTGTITGSEWVANCFFCIQNASQGLKVYSQFFKGTLPIGPSHPYPPDGFVT